MPATQKSDTKVSHLLLGARHDRESKSVNLQSPLERGLGSIPVSDNTVFYSPATIVG